MISAMRRYRKVLQVGLLVVVAAFVASLFIFGSRGVGGGPTPDTVATVNGESISIERFQHRYQAYVEAYRQVYRDRFSSELAEQLGLPQQVVNDLVQEELIVQRARREGLEVSDEEINEQIHAVRGFQENGRFALRLYQAFLRGRGTTAAAFEAEARQELTRLKAESTVRSGVKATPAEVEEAYAFRHDQARAAWALVELGPVLSATTVTDAELQAYLTAHAAEFRQPERRRIQYVTLAQKDFVKPVAEADVQKYYTEHAKEFEAPRQARVSHVLARVPETGGSEAEDKARAKAADVIRRAKAGEDFATLAKALSEDPGSAPKGGDLGFVKQGEMVPEFERAVFALKKGEVSPQPARTPFGYHAIKVFDVKPGGLTPLKAVAAQIREKLQAEAAERATAAKAGEVRPKLQTAKDWEAEAKALGLTVAASTVGRAERFPGLAGPDPLEDAVFALAQGGVSAPVRTPAGLVIAKFVEAIPAGVPPLAEVRDKVAAAAKREKAEAAVLARARRLAVDAKAGDFAAAAKKAGAQTGETGRFSRAKPADKLPADAMLAALGAPAGQITEPVKAAQGYYVLKVLERPAPDMSGLEAERAAVAKQVVAQKQSLAWQSWIDGARAGAKIDVSTRIRAPRG
jgi:peptidyl-prolyl cis-trans isomerase D